MLLSEGKGVGEGGLELSASLLGDFKFLRPEVTQLLHALSFVLRILPGEEGNCTHKLPLHSW